MHGAPDDPCSLAGICPSKMPGSAALQLRLVDELYGSEAYAVKENLSSFGKCAAMVSMAHSLLPFARPRAAGRHENDNANAHLRRSDSHHPARRHHSGLGDGTDFGSAARTHASDSAASQPN